MDSRAAKQGLPGTIRGRQTGLPLGNKLADSPVRARRGPSPGKAWQGRLRTHKRTAAASRVTSTGACPQKGATEYSAVDKGVKTCDIFGKRRVERSNIRQGANNKSPCPDSSRVVAICQRSQASSNCARTFSGCFDEGCVAFGALPTIRREAKATMEDEPKLGGAGADDMRAQHPKLQRGQLVTIAVLALHLQFKYNERRTRQPLRPH